MRPSCVPGIGGVFSGCVALFRARENEGTNMQNQYFKKKKRGKIGEKKLWKSQNRKNNLNFKSDILRLWYAQAVRGEK